MERKNCSIISQRHPLALRMKDVPLQEAMLLAIVLAVRLTVRLVERWNPRHPSSHDKRFDLVHQRPQYVKKTGGEDRISARPQVVAAHYRCSSCNRFRCSLRVVARVDCRLRHSQACVARHQSPGVMPKRLRGENQKGATTAHAWAQHPGVDTVWCMVYVVCCCEGCAPTAKPPVGTGLHR